MATSEKPLAGARRVAAQAAVIAACSVAVALISNEVRPDGIPLVTDIPYEIYAPCKDSPLAGSAVPEQLESVPDQHRLFVDARPSAAFAQEHAEGAVSVPYPVLFGAKPADIEALKQAIAASSPAAVVVYGTVDRPGAPGEVVDLAKPLAEQLTEAGIRGVTFVEGGLGPLKKAGVRTVQSRDRDGGLE